MEEFTLINNNINKLLNINNKSISNLGIYNYKQAESLPLNINAL